MCVNVVVCVFLKCVVYRFCMLGLFVLVDSFPPLVSLHCWLSFGLYRLLCLVGSSKTVFGLFA